MYIYTTLNLLTLPIFHLSFTRMSPGSTNIYKQQCGTETTQMPIIYEQSIYLKQTLFNLISQILSDVRCLGFCLISRAVFLHNVCKESVLISFVHYKASGLVP
ncbi:hypothetical protein NP493_2427g00004 [Ridgeia piscesae]|uniref:Uncharacterized protein n=1 Tax=Ridgeia piscesae TaxID=27915 RepID=A0AAD9JG08_RIDPI|nr:hypothetical protein NP493_2427g00004 [Ridgeia piscesae]